MKIKRFGAMLMALVMCTGMFSITAFAYTDENANTSIKNTENVETTSEKTEEQTSEEVPYTVTVNEDGTVIFSFNGEEWTYDAEESEDDGMGSGKVVTNGARLNVRTGAGMNHEIIDQLRPGEEVVVVAFLNRVEVFVHTGYEVKVDIEAHPVDCIAHFGYSIRTRCRADKLIAEPNATKRIGFVPVEKITYRGDRVEATTFTRDAIVFEKAIEAAHHLVTFRPFVRLRIPGVQRLACYGVTEEVWQSTLRTIPTRQYFRCEVKILPVTRLLVDHQQRFQYGHGRHPLHNGRSHIAHRDSTTADDINPVVHLGHH